MYFQSIFIVILLESSLYLCQRLTWDVFDSNKISIPIAAIIILVCVCLLLWRRHRANAAIFRQLATLFEEYPEIIKVDDSRPLNDQADILPYKRSYEINRTCFSLTKLIGEGEFGKVFKGILKMGETDHGRLVAIKIPNDPRNARHHRALIAELKLMIHLCPHINVVSLVGACTSDVEKQRLFVLTEYCIHGSLLDYLVDHALDFESILFSSGQVCKKETKSSINRLFNFAYQTANGVEFLAAENVIHRDLALRNLLLTSGDVVKISDFGMSRRHKTVYRKFLSPNVPVPIKWMALESINSSEAEYTQKSDVWSFGIVLWEIFSCGRVPYAMNNLETASELVNWLLRGCRLAKPKIATEDLYALMLECWKTDPSARPTFTQCKDRIGGFIEKISAASLSVNLTGACGNFSTTGASNVNDINKSIIDSAMVDHQTITGVSTDLSCNVSTITASLPMASNDYQHRIDLNGSIHTNVNEPRSHHHHLDEELVERKISNRDIINTILFISRIIQ